MKDILKQGNRSTDLYKKVLSLQLEIAEHYEICSVMQFKTYKK